MVLQDISLTVTLSVSVLATVCLSIGLILVLLVCLNCFRKSQGFSNFSNSTTSLDAEQGEINNSFSLNADETNGNSIHSSVITIEPLPDITSKLKPTTPLRPSIMCQEKARHESSVKLIAVHHPFPRNQIVYLKELGTGWFGKVIESDAERILTGVPRSKVVIKILKDDASREEQHLFFEEVAPFRELEHRNVIRLLGQCTETTPLLMIMESAAYGTLKQYLCSHRHSEALLIQKNRLLQFAVDAACGLACLHRHDYLHRDLAARNCLVMSDYTLKIGDYGIADDIFKEDYFTCGNTLLPIRWMAPETLKLDNATWTLESFSKESDIWALGVVLWEIATMGERPYCDLSDGEVLQKVVLDKNLQLSEPELDMPNMNRLYEVMRFCWLETCQRVQVDQMYSLLQQINTMTTSEDTASDTSSAFDDKWAQLMPNQHHRSADSIDGQLASASRGDAILGADLSLPDSLEDLTAPEMLQEGSFDVQAFTGDSLVGDTAEVPEFNSSQSCSLTSDDTTPVCLSSAACDPAPLTFHTHSSALLNDVAESSSNSSNAVLKNDRTESSDTELFGNPSSDCEHISLGFDVLDSSSDFGLIEEKSISESTTTSQSSITDKSSVHRDSTSDDFVVIPESKNSSLLTSVVVGGSTSSVLSEPFTHVDYTNDTDSQPFSENTPSATEMSGQQNTDSFMSLGTDLSSLSSLTVQSPSIDSDKEPAFPSFATELSSLSSLTVNSQESHTTSDSDDQSLGFQVVGNTASKSKQITENCASQHSLNDFDFDTLSTDVNLDSHEATTNRQSPSLHTKDDMIASVENTSSVSLENIASQSELTESETGSLAESDSQQLMQQSPPAGLCVRENASGDCVSTDIDSDDVMHSDDKQYNPEASANSSTLLDVGGLNELSLPPSSSVDNQRGSVTKLSREAMLHRLVSSKLSSITQDNSECLGAVGGVSEDTDFSSSYSDAESSSNSDSGKDYICEEELWDEQRASPPPSSSPTSSVDSEEYALQLASEIYLSKGLKLGKPFESTVLEPIPEDPIPSISEESVVPAPSESSSVDMRFDEVFEWDDFMGEPLVGKERSSPDAASPNESFDLTDWSLDMESDSIPSVSRSLFSHNSDIQRRDSGGSDLRATTSTDHAYARSLPSSSSSLSSSDRETAHSRPGNAKSYISDLLSNRTKGLNSASAHSSLGQNKFYSLYEEEFDLGSDSQSEGSESPPVAGFLSQTQHGQGGAAVSSSESQSYDADNGLWSID